MTLLTDEELASAIFPDSTSGLKPKPLVEPIPEDDKNFSYFSAIQPASIDLKVGAIFLPGAAEGKRGSANHGLDKCSLKPGETIVVESLETLNIPTDMAAIGFPPAGVAVKGLLMTNAGHIDPGFSGTLSFTLINMGREEYIILKGQKIFTLLFFKLGQSVKSDLFDRTNGNLPSPTVKQETLDLLTKDFLEVEKRVDRRVMVASSIAAIVLGGVATLLSFSMQFFVNFNNVAIEKRVEKIESNYESYEMNQKLEKVKAELSELKKLIKEESLKQQ